MIRGTGSRHSGFSLRLFDGDGGGDCVLEIGWGRGWGRLGGGGGGGG